MLILCGRNWDGGPSVRAATQFPWFHELNGYLQLGKQKRQDGADVARTQ
jgi:hypothetical protein